MRFLPESRSYIRAVFIERNLRKRRSNVIFSRSMSRYYHDIPCISAVPVSFLRGCAGTPHHLVAKQARAGKVELAPSSLANGPWLLDSQRRVPVRGWGAGGVAGGPSQSEMCTLISRAPNSLPQPFGKAAESFYGRFWRGHRTKHGQRVAGVDCEIRSWDNQARTWASLLSSSSWSLSRAGCRIKRAWFCWCA